MTDLVTTRYRVMNLGIGSVVADGLPGEDEAMARAYRELGRVPGGRFAVQVRDRPDE